jgi:hypothetical protein
LNAPVISSISSGRFLTVTVNDLLIDMILILLFH